MSKNNLRAYSAKILLDVIQNNRSLTHALNEHLTHYTDGRQYGLIQEICYGVMRFYLSLQKISEQFLKTPFKEKDQDIELLILIGLYQLIYTRVPPHAAIAETVEGCTTFKKPWATKVVNAILRNFDRQRTETLEKLNADEEYTSAHPAWLLKKIQKSWPKDWQAIIEANNQYPPMTLRVNKLMTTQDDYFSALEKVDLHAKRCDFSPHGLILDHAVAVKNLPDFAQGFVSVQDEASQLVATLMELTPNCSVLDACAAPGGKTAAMFEMEPSCIITSLDNDEHRNKRLLENKKRGQFKTKVICGDAEAPEEWWDKQPFDRILLDAPCTATGVIRRHPDIKFLRQPSDVASTVHLQRNILNALWDLLRTDGIFIYSTCSILPEENEQQIAEFLQSHPDAQAVTIDASWGRSLEFGRQILPGEHQMDGFYYAKIRKV